MLLGRGRTPDGLSSLLDGSLALFNANQRKEKMMKRNRKRLLFMGILASLLVIVSQAHAIPSVPLLMDGISKIKFVNYENWNDNNNNNIIDTDDDLYGILLTESITSVDGSIDVGDSFLTQYEVTGYFHLSVINGSIPIGGIGHIDFALQDDDFIRVYVDDTPDWNPNAANEAAAIATATDGDLWWEFNASAFYEGLNDTGTVGGQTISINRNWADIAVNNSGYIIVPLLWPEVLGQTAFHTYNSIAHNQGHVTDVYFESKLTTISSANWQFKSEDPLYVYATPEPGTMLLLGTGLIGLAGGFRRRRNKNG